MIICYNSGRIHGAIMDVMRLVICALFALQLLRAGDQPGSPASGSPDLLMGRAEAAGNQFGWTHFVFVVFFLRFFSRWCVDYHRNLSNG
jgi:hypothetical protein